MSLSFFHYICVGSPSRLAGPMREPVPNSKCVWHFSTLVQFLPNTTAHSAVKPTHLSFAAKAGGYLQNHLETLENKGCQYLTHSHKHAMSSFLCSRFFTVCNFGVKCNSTRPCLWEHPLVPVPWRRKQK